MPTERDELNRSQFSLRDLLLVVIGASICFAGLRALVSIADRPPWPFVAICLLPISGGLIGLLWRGFSGGIFGAAIGGVLAFIIRESFLP